MRTYARSITDQELAGAMIILSATEAHGRTERVELLGGTRKAKRQVAWYADRLAREYEERMQQRVAEEDARQRTQKKQKTSKHSR